MQRQFEVSTDSTCDLFTEEVQSLDIAVGRLNYTMTDNGKLTEHTDDFTSPEEYVQFFQQLRRGVVARTSILNVMTHVELFGAMAKRGVKKCLHISISYGLSPTRDNAQNAIDYVKKTYPDIDYRVIESSTATIGEGALVKTACALRDKGKSLDDAEIFLNDYKTKLQHFIIADDLMYLRRGGRVGTSQAIIGSVLKVKPILSFTREGKLEAVRKEMGFNKAIARAVNEYANFAPNPDYPLAVIVHTDNADGAELMRQRFEEAYGFSPEVRIMGPVIGAHVGPGAVALGFASDRIRPV